MRVGADYFPVLGARPVAWPAFRSREERPNADFVVGGAIWREYLGARADAIGHPLSLDGVRQRVVAVLSDSFGDPLEAGVDIWMPIDIQTRRGTKSYNDYLSLVARLRPGATLEQAQSESTPSRQHQAEHVAISDGGRLGDSAAGR